MAASASTSAMNPVGIHLPVALVDAVARSRPQLLRCEWFDTHGSCRKGAKCKFQHAGVEDQYLTLPYVSFNIRTGESEAENKQFINMTIRPPFDKAWEQIFQAASAPRRVQPGGQRFDGKILYQLIHMSQSDKILCTQTRSQGFVTVGGRTWGACPKAFPDYLGYICSFSQAMKILKAGVISKGTESRCGNGGVLGRKINVDSSQDMLAAASEAWDLAASQSDFAGLSFGCMFVLECSGCLVNGSWSLDIPPGSIATRDAFYAAHPTTIDFLAVMFKFDDLLEVLAPHMLEANTGYTKELHSSLVDCQKWLEQPQGDTRPTVRLRNAITMEGGRDIQEKQKALKRKEKEDLCAQRQQLWQEKKKSWHHRGAAEEQTGHQQQWQAN